MAMFPGGMVSAEGKNLHSEQKTFDLIKGKGMEGKRKEEWACLLRAATEVKPRGDEDKGQMPDLGSTLCFLPQPQPGCSRAGWESSIKMAATYLLVL